MDPDAAPDADEHVEQHADAGSGEGNRWLVSQSRHWNLDRPDPR
jgi:hypothetical protein